jgi:hypothetical protein
MFPMLTPQETFWFSAQLKLPFAEHNKKAKVDALIHEVTSWPISISFNSTAANRCRTHNSWA